MKGQAPASFLLNRTFWDLILWIIFIAIAFVATLISPVVCRAQGLFFFLEPLKPIMEISIIEGLGPICWWAQFILFLIILYFVKKIFSKFM